jgi:deoxycytidylate deaminase
MKTHELGIKESKNPQYKELLRECYDYSKRSNHPSTHNAAFLVKNNKVILKGANIFPTGVLEEREIRRRK